MERPHSPSATPVPISFNLVTKGSNGTSPAQPAQPYPLVARSEPTSPAITSLSQSASHFPSLGLGLGRPEPPPPDFSFASRPAGHTAVHVESTTTAVRPLAAPSQTSPPTVQVSRSVPASPSIASTSRIPLGANWAQPPPLDLHSSGSSRAQYAVADVPLRPHHGEPRRPSTSSLSSAPVSLPAGHWQAYSHSVPVSSAVSVASVGDRDDLSVASVDDTSMFGGETVISSTTAQYTKELAEGRIKMLREDNQMLRDNLRREQQAREDIAKLMREECGSLAKRVKDEYEQRAAAQSELDKLRAEFDSTRISAREAGQELERRDKLTQHLRERMEVLEGKLEAKDEELDQAKARMQSLEESVRAETARGDQERARADRTWEELTQARDKARALAAQLHDEQEEVKNAQMEIERLKSDLQLSEVRHADELDNLRRGMAASHADRMQEVLDENSAKMQEQISRNAKMQTEFSSMMAEQREVQDTADTMRGKLVAVSEELHRVNEENRDLKDRAAQLQAELSAAQGAMHLRSDHDALEGRMSSLEAPSYGAAPQASPRRLAGSGGASSGSSLLDSVRALQPHAQVAPRPVRLQPPDLPRPPPPPSDDAVLRSAPPPAHAAMLQAGAGAGRQGPPSMQGGTPQGSLASSFQGTPSDSLQPGSVTPHGSYHAPSPHQPWYGEQGPPLHAAPRMLGQRAPSPIHHPASAGPAPPPPPPSGAGGAMGGLGMPGGAAMRYEAPPGHPNPHPNPHWQPPPSHFAPAMPNGLGRQGHGGGSVGLHELTPEQIYMAGYDPNTVIGV